MPPKRSRRKRNEYSPSLSSEPLLYDKDEITKTIMAIVKLRNDKKKAIRALEHLLTIRSGIYFTITYMGGLDKDLGKHGTPFVRHFETDCSVGEVGIALISDGVFRDDRTFAKYVTGSVNRWNKRRGVVV